MDINENPQSGADLSQTRAALEALKASISRVIVGQDAVLELLLVAILSRGHVLIEGFPGLAKTLIAKLLAQSIDASFTRVQFTPDLMPTDLLGTNVFHVQDSQFSFKKGPIFSNVVLIDEINRAPAKTQSALFEAMEERQVTVDGVRYKLEEPFLIIATQNPIDLEGTYPLPEAQMDRFLFKLRMTYPSQQDEVAILERHLEIPNLHDLDTIEPVLTASQVIELQAAIPEVHIEKQILEFIASIVHKTRNHPHVYIGASPRASLALLYGARALAIIRGKDFVSPEDVIDIAVPALNHRIVLTAEREMEGGSVDQLVHELIASSTVPR